MAIVGTHIKRLVETHLTMLTTCRRPNQTVEEMLQEVVQVNTKTSSKKDSTIEMDKIGRHPRIAPLVVMVRGTPTTKSMTNKVSSRYALANLGIMERRASHHSSTLAIVGIHLTTQVEATSISSSTIMKGDKIIKTSTMAATTRIQRGEIVMSSTVARSRITTARARCRAGETRSIARQDLQAKKQPHEVARREMLVTSSYTSKNSQVNTHHN